jgi:hypothetical protein
MAAITCQAVILIAGHLAVVIIGILLVMLMTEYAFEYIEIFGVQMTVRAGGPLFPVTARKNGKVLAIVIPAAGNPGTGAVTILACGGKSHRAVVGNRVVVISLMA